MSLSHAGHQHDAHPHSHWRAPGDPSGGREDQQRRLTVILLLTVTFMFVEAAGGLISGSLALLADAGHMLSDSSAILLSLGAVWLARRETTHRRTFGFRRAEFLAAFVNALGLVALAVWIVVEAVERIGTRPVVLGGVMFWVALAGLGVNLVGVWLLYGRTHANLNLRSALWHLSGDVLGSLGAVVAAVVIQLTGWTPIDPLLSLGIALLIGLAGGRILYDSANLLMDRVPAEIDTRDVHGFLASYPAVQRVCDLHVWGVSSSETMLTAHLVVAPDTDRDAFLHRLLPTLQERFGLAHMTVQLEAEPHASCPDEW